MALKHPFAVGLGVGVASLMLWWKRHVIASWFTRIRTPLAGTGDTTALVQQLLQSSRQPVMIVVASDVASTNALVRSLQTHTEPPRTVIDAEGWPSAVPSQSTG